MAKRHLAGSEEKYKFFYSILFYSAPRRLILTHDTVFEPKFISLDSKIPTYRKAGKFYLKRSLEVIQAHWRSKIAEHRSNFEFYQKFTN